MGSLHSVTIGRFQAMKSERRRSLLDRNKELRDVPGRLMCYVMNNINYHVLAAICLRPFGFR